MEAQLFSIKGHRVTVLVKTFSASSVTLLDSLFVAQKQPQTFCKQMTSPSVSNKTLL